MVNTKDNSLWINKYKPTKASNIIGNKNAIMMLTNWIRNYNTNSQKSAIVSGHHGIGKTITVELIMKEAGYDPQILYPNDIKSHKLMEDLTEYTTYNDSIYNKMCYRFNKRYALIIDEAESITLTSENNYLLNLHKINNKNNFFPIIFICNTQHSKLITEIRKTSCEIKFFHPTHFEVKSLIKNIFKKENIK